MLLQIRRRPIKCLIIRTEYLLTYFSSIESSVKSIVMDVSLTKHVFRQIITIIKASVIYMATTGSNIADLINYRSHINNLG